MKNKNWKPFELPEIFDEIYMGKPSDSGNLELGTVPLIGRSSIHNGYENNYKVLSSKINHAPLITVSLVGRSTAFYQEFDFATSQNILILKHKNLNKQNGLFLVNSINNYLKPFIKSYGLPGSLSRMRIAKIMLPVNSENVPDWDYMENYSQKKLAEFTTMYHVPKYHHITDKRGLNQVEWGTFFIEKISKITGGKDWESYNRASGNSPFIGSSSVNNGVTDYVNYAGHEKQVGKGVISINRNGSVGYAFYHPYPAYFSGDTRVLEINNFKGNRFVNQFIVSSIRKQKEKYAYGYKMGTGRIKRQKIMLPSKDGHPDFEFMEQYMKRMENIVLEKVKNRF
ncbi:restriction endonuclease subunit S [Lactococcus formosensis]|uniref:restriction endonuclease subunit S n=1 Tax=Lactococcus TaxID=1357 RepID=UPI00254F5F10|nr:restriction endonuclease subunit S [Lactococcus formosensis]